MLTVPVPRLPFCNDATLGPPLRSGSNSPPSSAASSPARETVEVVTSGSDSEGPEDYLRRYLEEVDRHAPLSEKEERDLLQVVAADSIGAESAKRRIIEANLRLVVDLARKYECTERHLLDLIQEGNLGLVRAVETFDIGGEYKFETFARWSVRHAIASAIRGREN